MSSNSLSLPAGTRHYKTTATAESWEAWDALTQVAGWAERSWPVKDMKECEPGTPGARLHRQKECGRIVVFPPHEERA